MMAACSCHSAACLSTNGVPAASTSAVWLACPVPSQQSRPWPWVKVRARPAVCWATSMCSCTHPPRFLSPALHEAVAVLGESVRDNPDASDADVTEV